MKQIESPILNEVFNYYTNKKNYLNESLEEEGQCVVMDEQLFSDVMDMVQKGVYENMEDGQILIPTMGSYTLHITPSGECYLDDEYGNENEVQIDQAQLSQIMQSIKSSQYHMVSEGSNPFTNVQQDPETGFVTLTTKDGISDQEGLDAAHKAMVKAKDRRMSQKLDKRQQDEFNNRFNDPEWREEMRRKREGWVDKYKPWNQYELNLQEEANEADMYDIDANEKPDMGHPAAEGAGYIKLDEARLSQIVNNVIKQILK